MRTAATLVLPRQRQTVPVARAVLEATLSTLGVADDDVDDLAVALSEACSNAVRHARGASSYQIEITLEPESCTIVVTDEGSGFDCSEHHEMPPPLSARGRGIALMGALVDECEVTTRPGEGARVTLEKQVDTTCAEPFRDGSRGYGAGSTERGGSHG